MFGNKKGEDGEKKIADGCIQEYEIARDEGRIIIPIGSTGDAAGIIYSKIQEEREKDTDQYLYLEKYMKELKTEKNIDNIVNIVLEIVKAQRQ